MLSTVAIGHQPKEKGTDEISSVPFSLHQPGSGPRPLVTFRTMGGPLSIHIQVGNTWKENFDASSALCRWEPAWRSWF